MSFPHKDNSLPQKEEIVRFEETGSFYKKNKLTQSFLLIKKKLLAINLFARCLLDYNVSIKANEISIISCWELCNSTMDARIGRTLRMVWL